MSRDARTEVAPTTRDEMVLAEVLHALSDPIRIQIVVTLAHANGEVACGEFPLQVTKATVSHHFKVLRDAGVLDGRYEGTRRFHSLRRADLDARFPGLLDAVVDAAASDAERVELGNAP